MKTKTKVPKKLAHNVDTTNWPSEFCHLREECVKLRAANAALESKVTWLFEWYPKVTEWGKAVDATIDELTQRSNRQAALINALEYRLDECMARLETHKKRLTPTPVENQIIEPLQSKSYAVKGHYESHGIPVFKATRDRFDLLHALLDELAEWKSSGCPGLEALARILLADTREWTQERFTHSARHVRVHDSISRAIWNKVS